jgi:hypothetical protein
LVSNFLQQSSKENPVLKNHQFRALKVLNEGSVELNYLQGSGKPLQTVNQGDLERLQMVFIQNHGKPINVKQEIYRLPDRLLYALSLYYGLKTDSVWESIKELFKNSFIDQISHDNLQYAASFATLIRLNTYSQNGQQYTHLSLYTKYSLISDIQMPST